MERETFAEARAWQILYLEFDSLGTSVFGSCKKMDKTVQNHKLNECIIYIQGNTVTARYRYAKL